MADGRGEARIVRCREARRLPWKNGGGETVELAVHPRDASIGSFGWRVSLARVTSDGLFSTFLRVDRSLAVLDGEGLSLAVGAGRPVRLTGRDDPHAFAGEVPCRARLLGGPVTALNGMVERDSFACSISRFDSPSEVRACAGAVTVVVCAEGELETDLGVVGPYDALIVPADALTRFGSRELPARGVAVSLRPCGTAGR